MSEHLDPLTAASGAGAERSGSLIALARSLLNGHHDSERTRFTFLPSIGRQILSAATDQYNLLRWAGGKEVNPHGSERSARI